MKRMLIPHISEIIRKIKYFVYMGPGSVTIYSSTGMTEEEEADVNFYMSLPDEMFKEASAERLQQIKDVNVIDRMVHLCKEKLSQEQKDIIEIEYRKKYVIGLQDVQNLLDKFKQCNNIYYVGYAKTKEFIYEYKLSDQDLLDIVHSLTVKDYKNNTKNIVYPYLGNVLMVFNKRNVIMPNGESTSIDIYIKLDVDESTNDTVALLSIHEVDYE